MVPEVIIILWPVPMLGANNGFCILKNILFLEIEGPLMNTWTQGTGPHETGVSLR